MIDPIILLFLSSGLFLGWALGANDAANVFGTAVGTRMVSWRNAAIICSIFVILGAVISGAGTSQTLGKLGAITALPGAFMTALSAGFSVFVMTKSGLPVSTSQAIVGAIIGWNFFSNQATDTTSNPSFNGVNINANYDLTLNPGNWTGEKSGKIQRHSNHLYFQTADAGRLGAFDAKGMFQNSMTSKIKAVVPKNFRSTNWTGIAKRARIMYYSPERVNANELNGMTYEGLADPKWKGRVVIRKSNNIYNQSLVASLVKNNGKKATGEWAKGVVSNMALSLIHI